MDTTTHSLDHALSLPIEAAVDEWAGTGYIGIQGDVSALRAGGLARVESGFREAYVFLRRGDNGLHCGAVVKRLQPGPADRIQADPCLLRDLHLSNGAVLEVGALSPVPAVEVRVAASTSELSRADLEGLCRTYLIRQPLTVGQHKPIYLLTGEKVTLEILEVSPAPLSICTGATAIVVDSDRRPRTGEGLAEVGGLEQEKRILRERILLPITQPDFFARHGIRPPRGILLAGPPGCGKTMIARALAAEIDAAFFEVNGAEVFSGTYGETEKTINDVFVRAGRETPAIILIDEIDTLGLARQDTKGELERRAVTTLLTAMDGLRALGNVIVVGTTNTPDRLDPALRRPGRFDYEIHVGVPDHRGREDILHKKTAHMALGPDVNITEIARRTHGFVGADLMLLCREAAFSALTGAHPLEQLISGEATPEPEARVKRVDFDTALKRVKPSALREFTVEVPTDLCWRDVGGLPALKETLAEEVVQAIRNPALFESVGVNPARGILLYGPPGTGKTLLARVIANLADANFIAIRGPEVLSKWFGESEQRIRHLFRKARESSPCIVFFDEIDAISASRGNDTTGAADRIVNQLLTEMDGFDASRHVCVIGATNRVDTMDEALLRPGRFDHQILVPLPDREGLEDIYRIHCRNKPVAGPFDFTELAAHSRGFSGAHVAEVCRRAALTALRQNGFVAERTTIPAALLFEAIAAVRTTVRDVEKPGIGFTADL